jgi:hypothetical protein
VTGNVNGWAVLGGGIVASDGNNSIDGKPSRPPARLRIVRFSGAMLTYGVQDRSILGVPVRVPSAGERDRLRRRSSARQDALILVCSLDVTDCFH